METGQREELLSLLRPWLTQHPRPDQATLTYLGRSYSPEDIVEEIQVATEFGENLGSFLYETAKRFNITVADVINRAIVANKENS